MPWLSQLRLSSSKVLRLLNKALESKNLSGVEKSWVLILEITSVMTLERNQKMGRRVAALAIC